MDTPLNGTTVTVWESTRALTSHWSAATPTTGERVHVTRTFPASHPGRSPPARDDTTRGVLDRRSQRDRVASGSRGLPLHVFVLPSSDSRTVNLLSPSLPAGQSGGHKDDCGL